MEAGYNEFGLGIKSRQGCLKAFLFRDTESSASTALQVHTLFHAPGVEFPTEGLKSAVQLEVTENVFKKIVGLESVDGMWIAAEVDHPWQSFSLDGVCLHRLLVLESVQVHVCCAYRQNTAFVLIAQHLSVYDQQLFRPMHLNIVCSR